MIKVVITAHHGTGDKKVLAGNRTEEKPETLNEAVEKYGEAVLLELAWQSHVINVQRAMRARTEPQTNTAIFKKLTPEQQVAALAAAGIKLA